jgi:ParB family transcriptional regulator, chromosome partitioning protein
MANQKLERKKMEKAIMEVRGQDALHDTPTAEPTQVVADTASRVAMLLGDARVEYVPYSRLCLSRHNVRQVEPTGIAELAATIRTMGGIIQNLVVHTMKGSRRKPASLGICAGRRRYTAFGTLVADGTFERDALVPVLVVSEAQAVAISLIENTTSEAMHPADHCYAFRMLVNEGRTLDQIAAVFGVTVLHVKRHLAIADVSPRILSEFRTRAMSIDQVRALALTDDHDLQERLWFDQSIRYKRSASELRAVLTASEINTAKHPIARFVGVESFVQAGGYVRHDLFSDTGEEGFTSDLPLLTELAEALLQRHADRVLAEGWSWVQIRLQFPTAERAQYRRYDPTMRPLTEDEEQRLRELATAYEHAEIAYDGDPLEDGDDVQSNDAADALAVAEAALDGYKDSLTGWPEDVMKHGGAFVYIAHDGTLVIDRGYVEHRSAVTQEGDSCTVPPPTRAKTRATHGPALCRQLTAHRTAIAQAELARQPNLALALMLKKLVLAAFPDHYDGDTPDHGLQVSVNGTRDELLRAADDMEASKAFVELEQTRAHWLKQLPRNADDLLTALLALPGDKIASLFAYCVASALNSITVRETAHDVSELLALMNVDISRYWTPTREAYLGHVTKARIVAVVSEATTPEQAADLSRLTKDGAANAAERRLASTKWSPGILRGILIDQAPAAYAANDDANDDA